MAPSLITTIARRGTYALLATLAHSACATEAIRPDEPMGRLAKVLRVQEQIDKLVERALADTMRHKPLLVARTLDCFTEKNLEASMLRDWIRIHEQHLKSIDAGAVADFLESPSGSKFNLAVRACGLPGAPSGCKAADSLAAADLKALLDFLKTPTAEALNRIMPVARAEWEKSASELVVGSARACAQREMSALRNENLLQKLPAGYKVGYRARNDHVVTGEVIPVAESIDSWSRKVSTQYFLGPNPPTLEGFRSDMQRQWLAACEKAESASIMEGEDNGYPFAMWMLSCARSEAAGKPEYKWIKAVKGNDGLYVVQKTFRFKPDARQVARWTQYLRSTMVCDTRIAARPCTSVEGVEPPRQVDAKQRPEGELTDYDIGTYALADANDELGKIHLSRSSGKWILEGMGKQPDAKWNDLGCEAGCEYTASTSSEEATYLTALAALFPVQHAIACVQNIERAFCRLTSKVDSSLKYALLRQSVFGWIPDPLLRVTTPYLPGPAADGWKKPHQIITELRLRMISIGASRVRERQILAFIAAGKMAADEIGDYASNGDRAGLVERNSMGQTPLMAAAFMGFSGLVEELLKSPGVRESIDEINPQGMTAWLYANTASWQAMWVCRPAVLNEAAARKQLLAAQYYYLGPPESPYLRTRRLLEQAGARTSADQAKRLWQETCRTQQEQTRANVQGSRDILEAVIAEAPEALKRFDIEQKKRHSVYSYYRITDGAIDMCKRIAPGQAEQVEAAVGRLRQAHPELMMLVQHSPFIEYAKRQNTADVQEMVSQVRENPSLGRCDEIIELLRAFAELPAADLAKEIEELRK
ncbi:hypothetical protein [Ramlibacter albus]|uniref:Ankyrin repeat domain-containing protein n=1 Tax=Ramlibacter albus TaxID=2079448 RepID=A0A923MES9_9BURK|nr:hypothetical protein [Ramlibacter albus]MBC5767687.1 hypothetical protein [Ramlibacter albus]